MKQKIAKNGPMLSKIVAGVMKWGTWGAKLDKNTMAKLIEDCCELGVTSFDHADIYGAYTTEREFGAALNESKIDREKIQLITKCGICYPSDERPQFAIKSYDTSKDYIRNCVELSLKNLQADYLDLLLIHRPSPIMNLSEIAEAFQELLTTGKVKYFGVSNFTTQEFQSLNHFFPLVTNQVEASLTHLNPFEDGTFLQCQKLNFSPMIWSPLGGGSLFAESSDYELVTRRGRFLELAKKYDLALDEMAYIFLLHHPASLIPVTGSSKISRIKTAVDSLSKSITDEQWFEIWTASKGKRVP